MIEVYIGGSFAAADLGVERRLFGALRHGHAQAVAETIAWLSADVLPAAIALDHKLQTEGHVPREGFARP